MLARLSIRDIVLIDRLDIDFGSGLAVLTGETGAGKSILLDAFALALGARGEAALVRQGARSARMSGSGSAVFGLFDERAAAERCAAALASSTVSTWVTRTTGRRQHARLTAVEPLSR